MLVLVLRVKSPLREGFKPASFDLDFVLEFHAGRGFDEDFGPADSIIVKELAKWEST